MNKNENPTSQTPAKYAPSREALLGAHTFPGEFIIKAFGPNLQEFRHEILACAHRVLTPQRVEASERSTKSGHKICITLTLAVEQVEEVESLYEQIYQVTHLQMIL